MHTYFLLLWMGGHLHYPHCCCSCSEESSQGSIQPRFEPGTFWQASALTILQRYTPVCAQYSIRLGAGIRHVTKYLYIKSTTVVCCALIGIGTPPTPLLQASVPYPPPPQRVGGAHSPAAKEVGESQFRRLEKKLALCLHCMCAMLSGLNTTFLIQ